MSFENKIKKAKKTNWLTKGLTDEEVKQIIKEAKEKAKEQRKMK